MKQVNIVSIFLICSTASIFCSQPTEQSKQKEELEQLFAKREIGYQLHMLEKIEQAHQEAATAHQKAKQAHQENHFEEIIWKHPKNECMQRCEILAMSSELLEHSVAALFASGVSFILNDPFSEGISLGAGIVSMVKGCLLLGKECLEFNEYKRKHSAEFPKILYTAPKSELKKMQ